MKEVRKNASLKCNEILPYQCPERKWNLEVECGEEGKIQSKWSDICENVQGGVLHHVYESEHLKANMFLHLLLVGIEVENSQKNAGNVPSAEGYTEVLSL
jgi:hypothetical protein